MAAVTQIFEGGQGAAVPLTGLITVERRSGKPQAVIKKALVTLDSPAFQFFASRRAIWAASDVFSSPGPRQMWGDLGMQVPATVALNLSANGLAFRIGSTL
jgi:pyrophosphate--fructose-6-phosphate 1-phosphotransferase